MENKIWYISKTKFDYLCNQWKKDDGIYVAVMEGKLIQCWNQYLDKMYNLFQMPHDMKKGHNAYLDWMRDLEWLHCKKYIFVVNNYQEFMKRDVEMKKSIIKDFEDYILPFWEKEVMDCVVGGYPKEFEVFLVD